MEMVPLLLGVLGGLIGAAAGALVVFFSSPRRRHDSQLESRVDDIAISVERMMKSSRRERMASIRAMGIDETAVVPSTPSQLHPADLKRELRRRVLSPGAN